MDAHDSPLGAITLHFALMSMLMIGGANAVIPELHRLSVDTYGWMSDADFTSLFGIAQAVPGPNVLFVTLIGLKAAGLPGAITAALATFDPPGAMFFVVGRLWERFREAKWRRVVEQAIAPLGIGLVLASGVVIARSADSSWQSYALTVVACILGLTTKLNWLVLLAGGAVAGVLGLV